MNTEKQIQQIASRVQSDTYDLCMSLCSQHIRMSQQTKLVCFLSSINLSPEQIALQDDIDLKVSSIIRMQTRYKDVISYCREYCIEQYKRFNLIDE
ncbi:hypothetical protein [Salinivibrio proteolyticus]|uniref:hypothetical protein n=1 Tax=Salinivibrio proteolyticus TaxID=334715 RepID=UPI001054A45C|nr:hypothetical protein [Salinivibrio proteolyticus]